MEGLFRELQRTSAQLREQGEARGVPPANTPSALRRFSGRAALRNVDRDCVRGTLAGGVRNYQDKGINPWTTLKQHLGLSRIRTDKLRLGRGRRFSPDLRQRLTVETGRLRSIQLHCRRGSNEVLRTRNCHGYRLNRRCPAPGEHRNESALVMVDWAVFTQSRFIQIRDTNSRKSKIDYFGTVECRACRLLPLRTLALAKPSPPYYKGHLVQSQQR